MIGGKLYAAGGAELARRRPGDVSRSTTSRTRRWTRGPDMPTRPRAPRRRGRRRRVLRARRTRGRSGQLQGRRALSCPRRSRWERLPDMAQAARRDRRGRGRRTRDRGRRRRGGRRDDRRGRGVRPGDAPLDAGCRDMRTPRHGLGVVSRGRTRLHDRGRPARRASSSRARSRRSIAGHRPTRRSGRPVRWTGCQPSSAMSRRRPRSRRACPTTSVPSISRWPADGEVVRAADRQRRRDGRRP